MVKIECPNCGSMSKATKEGTLSPYHECKYPFTTKFYNDAYTGDALHKLDVRRMLLAKGFTYSDSVVQETKYVSNESQAQYLKTTKFYKPTMFTLGVHKLGTIFEEHYYNNEEFRREYLWSQFNFDY